MSVQDLPGFALWDAWRRTSPSCRSCCAGRRHPSKSPSHLAATQRYVRSRG